MVVVVGKEGNSHPLNPNLKVELGVLSLFKERKNVTSHRKTYINRYP